MVIYVFVDINSFMQATVSVMYTLSDNFDVVGNVNTIIKALTSNTDHPKLRMKALVTLLNLVVESEVKYTILTGKFPSFYFPSPTI